MIAVRVRLLHGWTRATGRGDDGLMGSSSATSGEWPLSPSRLFAALVAGGGTGEHRRVPGDDSELRKLEAADPPIIVADGPADVLRSPIVERFVVVDERKQGVVQNYPARNAAIARSGIRLCPRTPEVAYVWPDLELDDAERRALEMRAARVGYLGASDAPAHVVIADAFPIDPDRCWTPDSAGSTGVNVPTVGFLAALDDAYQRFITGSYITGATIPRSVVRYRAPGDEAAEHEDRPIVITARLDRSVSGRRALRVAEALKGLILSAFGPAGSADEAPPILTGHGVEPGAERARYLALPFVGRHGSGRLLGVGVVLPVGTDRRVVQRVRNALASAELRLPGGTVRSLAVVVPGPDQPFTLNPVRWSQPASTWVSVTPVVHERHREGGPTLEDVRSWCEHAGLRAPIDFRVSRVPLIEGGVDLLPHETRRRGGPSMPYSHLRLWFDEPVAGPISVGQLRYLGLGLMVPERAEQVEAEEAGR